MIADTFSTQWNGSGSGGQVLGNVFTWSDAVSCFDSDEVTLLITPDYQDPLALGYQMRVQWSADIPGYRWVDDTFVTTPLQAGGVNSILLWINQWTFLYTDMTLGMIAIPAQAHFIRVAFRQVADPGVVLTTIDLDIERHRTDPTQN